ncbi:MAG: chloride channel protein [Bacteroidota bacterium]
MTQITNLVHLISAWRLRNISPNNFLLLLSLFIGVISALSAVILKDVVFYTSYWLRTSFSPEDFNYLYLVFPGIGIMLTVLFVKFIVKDKISHGVSRILWAISQNKGNIDRHNTWSSLVASTLTVGFGGSVGLEAPIVYTGSAIGSNVGRVFKLDTRSKILLVACGATGAMAAIFKAPIAAIVFAIEVLMIDLTTASLMPLLLASVAGTTISFLLLGKSVMFSYTISSGFQLQNIPFYIVLGVFTGAISIYFSKTSGFIESLFKKINKTYVRIIIGGTVLSILIFLFPLLYGEGYDSLIAILNGRGEELLFNTFFYDFRDNAWLFLGFLLLVLVFKIWAMATTNGAGGVGGVFAPSLFMGGLSGYFMAMFIKVVFKIDLPVENFVLAGMAGVMSGVMHAPLTSIFLIAELTSGYQLFIPLMITSALSFITVMPFEPYSIYTKRLAARGELITHHKDKAALSQINVAGIIETNFSTINKEASLRELVKVISESKRNIFPVVDQNQTYLGLVLLDEIRDVIFNAELYDSVFVSDLMKLPEVTITPEESMVNVVKKLRATGYYNMPVVTCDGKYIGFISRANLYTNYKNIIETISED